jgi:translation initiation factor 2B subunit (eIF-2B alpha/beta/delta family)
MLSDRIAALAADRVSGASDILARAIVILRQVLAGDADVAETARGLVRAQPSMAPMWNAALAALAGPERFEAFAARVRRATASLTRHSIELFGDAPPHIVTLSYSGSVAAVLEAVAGHVPVQVTCSDSAPAMEGRALAARLATAGVSATCVPDDEIEAAVRGAGAVMVGADAVAATWFLNKVGTRSLAAAAAAAQVPVYVVASRDKFAGMAVASRLAGGPLFERTPLAKVTGVITDAGVLEPGMVPEVCAALDLEAPPSLLALVDGIAGP